MTKRVWRRSAALVMATLAAGGCDPAGEGGALPVVVRDSAGVEIVENHAPAWAIGDAWSVEVSPILAIGSLDGDDAYLFARIDATLLPDGGVAVVDIQSSELRLFDAQGAHVVTTGGLGDGPGELRYPDQVFRMRGDSLVVTSYGGRITVFGPEGRYGRTWAQPAVGWPFAIGDQMEMLGLDTHMSGRYDGYERGTSLVVKGDSTGVVDTLASFQGEDFFLTRVETGVSNDEVPFGRNPLTAFEPDRVHVGNGDTWQVLSHAIADGRLLRILRRSVEARPVTDQSWERHQETYLGSLPEEYIDQRGPEIRQRLERAHRLETMPAYDRLLVDPTGHLWVRRFAPAWEETSDWDVVDSNGRWLGTVRFPTDLDVLEIATDRVLGTVTDELDVVRVRVHRLRR